MKKPLLSLLILLAINVAADQGSKQWAYHNLVSDRFHEDTDSYPACGTKDEEIVRARFVRRNQRTVDVVDDFFSMRYVENCAAAFGLMSSVPVSFRLPFFLIVSIMACVFISWLYTKTPPQQRLLLYALPFVLGGALGNLIDRMVYRFVIDFVDWYVVIGGIDRHWPTFNIADVSIVVGIGLMFLQMIPRRNAAASLSGPPAASTDGTIDEK